MSVEPIFDLHLEGQLDQARLDWFRKLLNLTPHGRLTDTEDFEFGNRRLYGTVDEQALLTLWRRDGNDFGWAVRLTFNGRRPDGGVVDRSLAEVLGAAAAVGLSPGRIWPAPRPVGPQPMGLPTQRALSAILGADEGSGRLSPTAIQSVQRSLHLYRELGGPGGYEYGWRYVQWDPPGNSVLLQLFQAPGAAPEVALLFQGQPPGEETAAGCRLQIAVAAAVARLPLVRLLPDSPYGIPVDDWAGLAARAAQATSLAELLSGVGITGATPFELARGRLLAVVHQTAWSAVPPDLQRQADDYLLGLAAD